jgi:hypothetical protein
MIKQGKIAVEVRSYYQNMRSYYGEMRSYYGEVHKSWARCVKTQENMRSEHKNVDSH